MNRRATFQSLPPIYHRQRFQVAVLGVAVGLITVAMILIFWVVTR